MINNWTSQAGASNMVSLGWIINIFEASTGRVIAIFTSDRVIKVEGNKCV